MTACGTDYLTKDIVSRSYILFYSIFVYFMPLFLIIYSYFFIIQAVAAHEKNMREQAKKMNVASLRSAENQSTSAECKLAKASLLAPKLSRIVLTYTIAITMLLIIGSSHDHLFVVYGVDSIPSHQLRRHLWDD